MPTSRSYRDSCGMARALDVVGERWALLVVRELLLVPRRFSELRHALPNASSNLLADRLRELEHHGVIRRRKLASTAGPQVYELTEWGRKLEPTVLALSDWGIDAPTPPEPTSLSATSVSPRWRTILTPPRRARAGRIGSGLSGSPYSGIASRLDDGRPNDQRSPSRIAAPRGACSAASRSA